MIKIRRSDERGHANHGWLDTFHTFSFAGYYDSEHMGFRCLRVINQDIINPGYGFGTHPHKDMEIITYIISGCLEHRDNTGHNSIIRPGQLQRMTAGTGIQHSEKNPSKTEPVHLLQIWIQPDTPGHMPEYEQIDIIENPEKSKTLLLASVDGRNGSMKIHQDVDLYLGNLQKNKETSIDLAKGRSAWIQMIKGKIKLNGKILAAGDGVAITEESNLQLHSIEDAEYLLFDLN